MSETTVEPRSFPVGKLDQGRVKAKAGILLGGIPADLERPTATGEAD
jgi:hypothetical protein